MACLAACMWTPRLASATWSITAVDTRTGEVGVAAASCVAGVNRVIALVPGVGAIAAQAHLDERNRDMAQRLLSEGLSPEVVVARVNAQDPRHALRQYGVVDLQGRVAAYTGAEASAWAGHQVGEGASVQGNLLTGQDVLEAALRAFEADPPDDEQDGAWTLADRLLVALEAGAARGGDRRCDRHQAALSAALRVAASEAAMGAAGAPGVAASAYLDLYEERSPGQPNPVAELRRAYDVWRQDHPRAPRPVDPPAPKPSPQACAVERLAPKGADAFGALLVTCALGLGSLRRWPPTRSGGARS